MGYYKVADHGDGVYSFFEMVGVGSHLIVGDEKALLIDTGYNFGNLRAAVKKVCDKPLIVVNSHVHADHALGNGQFERVYVNGPDLPNLTGDYLEQQQDILMDYGLKVAPTLRLVLLYAKFRRKPHFSTEILPMPEEMRFDLGGREIRFVGVPGHTPGSMIALDARSKTIFAGDAVNPGAFLFFDPALRLDAYAAQLDEIAKLTGFDQLRISHQVAALPFAFVGWYAGFLRRATLEKSTATDFPNGGRTVLQYTEKDTPYGDCSVFFCADNLSSNTAEE